MGAAPAALTAAQFAYVTCGAGAEEARVAGGLVATGAGWLAGAAATGAPAAGVGTTIG
jgi:hypothetical protein